MGHWRWRPFCCFIHIHRTVAVAVAVAVAAGACFQNGASSHTLNGLCGELRMLQSLCPSTFSSPLSLPLPLSPSPANQQTDELGSGCRMGRRFRVGSLAVTSRRVNRKRVDCMPQMVMLMNCWLENNYSDSLCVSASTTLSTCVRDLVCCEVHRTTPPSHVCGRAPSCE